MKTKLITICLLAGLLPTGIIGVITLSKAKSALQEKSEGQLMYVLKVKKSEVENYFNRKLQEVSVLSKTADAVIAYRALNAYLEDGDISPIGSYDISTEEYQEIYNGKCQVFQEYMREYGYTDIYLIHGEYGHVMYSGNKGKDLGTNLKTGKYASSNLADLWKKVVENKSATIVDIQSYAPRDNQPAMFAGSPILDGNGNVIGVTAFQIPLEQVDAMLNDREGLGETGESYLVGHDKQMRSNSPFNQKSIILSQRVETETSEMALDGETGVKIVENYREESVLSAYMPVIIGGFSWAILAEISTDEVFAAASVLQKTVIIIELITGLAVILAGLAFARSVANPLNKVVRLTNNMTEEFGQFVEFVDAISGNDLTRELSTSQLAKININSKDEIGLLAMAFNGMSEAKGKIGESLNRMTDNLNKMVRSIKEDAAELINNSNRIAAAAEQLTNGSEKVVGSINVSASSSEEISGNMNSVAASVEQMSSNIKTVSDSTTEMSDSVNNVSAAVEELSSALREVSKNSDQTAQIAKNADETARSAKAKMDSLATNADQIGKIVNSITDIADQTNLLALNATIEAASAGDAGKGFAVVANEVKELAKQTAQATTEITQQMGKMQNDTTEAVSSIADILLVTDRINEISAMVANAIEQQSSAVREISSSISISAKGAEAVSTNTKELAQGTSEISRFVNEATTGASGIAKNVSEAATITNEMGGNIVELSRIAVDLKNQANNFGEIVNKFKVLA